MTDILSRENVVSNRLADYTKLTYKYCPFCGSEMLATVLIKPQIDRCIECGHAFRQEKAKITDEQPGTKPAILWWLESHAVARHHYNFINRAIGFKTIDSILVIGAGDGFFLKYIRNKHDDLNITVVEPDNDRCRMLSEIRDISVVEDHIENIHIERKFDLVILANVLEHIKRPQELIRHIYADLLTSSGFLYIDTPNQDYELQSAGTASKMPADNLYFFNGAGMKELLLSSGFKDYYFRGVKYKTLPSTFGKVLGWIHKLETGNANKHIIKPLSAINEISLYAFLAYRNFTFTYPKEIPIDSVDFRYNNIAIVVRK